MIMILRSIEYQGFRNLTDDRLEFSGVFNVFNGENGAGKTNLLEAIFYACVASSFRVKDERNLIRINHDCLRLTARSDSRTAQVFFNGEKRLLLQGQPVKSLNEYIGWLPVTILSLEDIWIIRGAPVKRRSFLDWLITKLNPSYLTSLAEYRRVLRQRNRVLQTARFEGDPGLLDAYDEQLVRLGNELYRERSRHMPGLFQRTVDRAGRLGLRDLQAVYESTCPDRTMTVEQLRRVRANELKWGETTVGPHRDDIRFLVAGRPIRDFASEGEERTAAIALKLAEIDLLQAKAGAPPIILMDEATAEFDERRVSALLAMLHGQIFYSSTRPPDFPIAGDGRRFRVAGGRLEVSGPD